MGSKSLVGMCTGLDNSLIFLECSLTFTQPLVSTCVQWYFVSDSCIFVYFYLLFRFVFLEFFDNSWFIMQMTVLVVYIFLYGRVYLVSGNLNHIGGEIILSNS